MLKWVFGADTGPYRSALGQMRKQTEGFASSIKGQLGAALGIGAVMAAFRGLFVEMDRVQKLALRFGETSETIQRLKLQAELAGSSVESIAKAMAFATKSANDAANGSLTMAENFERLGISAADFVNMGMDDKIYLLADSMAKSNGSGERLADMMAVIGKSGGELIPLLSQGSEKLRELFAGTSVASNDVVDSIAALNDAMETLKSKSAVVLADMIDGFRLMGASVEWALNKAFAGKGVAAKQFDLRLKGIDEGPDNSAKARAGEAMRLAEEALAIEKERLSLAEKLAKLQEDSRMSALSLSEKIFDAELRLFKARKAEFSSNENDQIKAGIERIETEKELAGYKDEQIKLNEQKDKAEESAAKEIFDLEKRGKELDRANAMAGMSEAEKLELLTKERDQALAEAKAASEYGMDKESLEASNKAKGLTGEINSMERSIRATADDMMRATKEQAESDLASLQSRGPTIATSSLADIGGGGGARLMEQDYGKKTVDLLAIIAANTAGGEEGSRPPEPI